MFDNTTYDVANEAYTNGADPNELLDKVAKDLKKRGYKLVKEDSTK